MNRTGNNEPTLEMLAFMDLKEKIVKLMFDFTTKYSGIDKPENLYPRTPYILIDILTACLNEAQHQVAWKNTQEHYEL